MKKPIASVSFFSLLCIASAFAQNTHLPRDPEKLVLRAQALWADVMTHQQVKALEFVLPEKKDAFLTSLAGGGVLFIDAKVDSIGLTPDPLHAVVHVQVQILAPGSMEKNAWTLTQTWVWKGSNWYLDVGDSGGLTPFAPGAARSKTEVADMQKSIDQQLTLPNLTLDIGTVAQGKKVSFAIPVIYSGNLPLSVDLAVPYESFSADTEKGGLTSQSKSFTVFFDSSSWDDVVSLPLRIRFHYQAAVVERILTVQGRVFAPISFRQSPPDGPAKPDAPFSVFIRNNTSEEIAFPLLSTDNKVEIVKTVTRLPANQESEVILKLKAGEIPGDLILIPQRPIDGLGQFSYHIRINR